MSAYRKTCPKCGGPLAPVAQAPESAPWVCSECHLGFFTAELTTEAREAYRPFHHDFGPSTTKMMEVVRAEREKARGRGTSLRRDQIALVHPDALAVLADRLSGEFASVVRQRLGGE